MSSAMKSVGSIFGSQTRKWSMLVTIAAFTSQSFGNATATPPAPPTPPIPVVETKETFVRGIASYYAHQFHGRQTASGEIFNMYQLTAAHRSYKFGTRVKVTHLGNNRSVVVRINDRGPNGRAQARLIDLSRRAAEDLDIVHTGVTRVEVRIVDGP